MSEDRLNTIDPKVAERWVGEYERNEAELVSYAARCREGRKPYVERRGSIVERASDAGLNRGAFLDELKERALRRKIEALNSCEGEEVAEQRRLLKDALGGLPLGDWGVGNISVEIRPSYDLQTPPESVPDGREMTLEQAKETLAKPKARGRMSNADKALREAAEWVIAHADRNVAEDAGLMEGASGAKAAAMAEVMESADTLSSLVDEDNIRDFRPRFIRSADGPDEAA